MIKNKNKKSKLLNLLNEEHCGSEGVESVLVSPLIFGTFLVLFYFFFMALSFILYNNIANAIAQELNMRQSGYESAINNYATAPQILTFRNSTNGDIPPSGYLSASKMTATPNTNALRSGMYFALDKNKNKMTVPFTELLAVRVYSTKNLNPSMGRKMAGTVIRVEIDYNTMTLGEIGRTLTKMTATGYSIIS